MLLCKDYVTINGVKFGDCQPSGFNEGDYIFIHTHSLVLSTISLYPVHEG